MAEVINIGAVHVLVSRTRYSRAKASLTCNTRKLSEKVKIRRTQQVNVIMDTMWVLAALLTFVGFVGGGPTNKLVFLEEPENVTGRAGERLQLNCEVSGRGRGDQGHCTWTKDNHEVEMGERIRLEGCNLVVDPLLVRDEGEYRCHSGQSLISQPAMVRVEAEPGRPYIVQAREGDVLEVKEGRPVVLECSSQGARPAAELIWRYGKVATSGFDIQEDISRMEDGRTWKTTSRFKFVPLADQEVVCSAHSDSFPDPKDSRALHLKLVYRPRVVVEALPSQAREGQDVTFTCSATASPGDVTYKWFINDNEIEDQAESTLTLKRVGREHNLAEVRCRVENSVGTGEAATTLGVAFQPKITSQPKSVVAREGEEVSLECRAEASPQPQYAWLKVGEREEVVGVSSVLTITATKKTVGRYVCRVFVEGRAAINSEEASVSLLAAPRVHLPEVVRGRIGEAVVVDCRVESQGNTSVVWTRQPSQGRLDSLRDQTRQRVVRSETGEVTVHSELILPNIKPEDFATYGCFAQNSAGTDYRVLALEEEQMTDWVSMMVVVNTLLGLTVLAGVLACHYYKKRYAGYEQPTPERAVLPPIYRGEDPAIFDEVLLRDGMTENYGSISNEYFDNAKNEKKIDLRIV